nr:SNF2-related protein [Nitrosomonas nitrosa]
MVPKSVLANWYVESQKWFPGSKVLTIGGDFSYNGKGELVGRDDNKNERERKYHDLTQNDYDFVIISEPVFQEIDLDPVTKKEMYDTDFWVQRGDSLGNAGDKRVKKIREAYEQSIAKREFEDRTGVIYFNDLGVDMIIADEAHHTKNLYAAKSRFGDNPKFLGGQGLSNRALDFNLKARWLLGQNGGKGVYGLTATPTKNSPLEIYSMLSHIAPEAFENIGIRNSEEFLDRFCKFERDNVLGTNGEIEEALVVAGFKNMEELRTIMNRYVRRTTAEDVGLILPKRDDRMHLIDMTPEQQAVYTELREMAAEAAKKDATGDAHIFSVMDKMNKAALDLEIYDPVTYQGASSPKYEALAKHVAEGIKEGGQVVFADYVDAHDKIVKALVKAGIPKNQIGIINAQVASSAVKRQNIADQFNSGKLKVVIGNTATMGEGINLQKSTTDIHHLDLPWEPASIQQRNGRGLRQGNNKEAVRIHTYLSKGSFDGYRYQSISAKKDWQDLLWKGGDTIENLAREGNISRDEMLIMLSADPEAARAKFDSDKEAALERYEAGERAKASEEFVRFQSLRASYQSLKNKNTTSAALLQSKLEKTRIALKGNRFFTGKSLMDSATNALMEPQTGQVFHANVAFHAVDEKGESEGKFVVTGVNLKVKTVTVRPYADINGRKKIVKLSALNHGITPFAFDADSEAKELAAKMESDAANKANNITDYKQLAELPSRVLHASHDAIQKQLKDGAKSYNITFPSSDIPMVSRENGGIELVKNYSIRNKLDSHDFLLPTDEAKKKLEDAWLNEERNARFGTTFISTGRRGSSSQTHAVKEYQNADYSNKQRNPWSEHIAAANGEKHSYYEDEYGTSTPSIKALRERFKREQIERAKKADTLNETIDHLAPLGVIQDKVKGYGAKVKLPKKALAILWAKARHWGILGDKLIDHLPKHERGYEKHSSYFHGSRKDKSVHAALIGMTRDSGHDDLVAAMVESGLRHHKEADHKEILSDLHQGYGHSDQVLKMMLKLAEASGIADMNAVNADTGIQNAGILRPRQWGGDEHKTIREIIEGRIKNG